MASTPDIPDDFNPQPTQLQGGIARMIRCWESCRDNNAGGYGSGVVHSIKGWSKPSPKQVTSCSPFTATVIGMIFDQSNSESSTVYEPKYNNGRTPLPVAFYCLHNGFYFDGDIGKLRRRRFVEKKWETTANDSAGALLFFNLGYEIEPRDMRRGDFVAIDWANGNGHATFCWDVHLDADGAVDCFEFLSSNGRVGKGGVGVTVSNTTPAFFVKQESDGTYKKARTIFADGDWYLKYGKWICLPRVARTAVDRAIFREPVQLQQLVDSSAGGYSASRLRVVRFWGVNPPEHPHGDLLKPEAATQARTLGKENPPEPFAVGKCKPVEAHILDAPVTRVSGDSLRNNPDAVKSVPAKPAQQKKEHVVAHQSFVEQALSELHAAGWIDRSPGKADSVGDNDTRTAVRDLQTKLKVQPVDGIAGPITRRALRQALADLRAGKPNPNKPDTKPRIDHFYWLKNRVGPGELNGLAVHGLHLDLVQSFEVTLKDDKSGHAESLTFPLVAVNGKGVRPLVVPPAFGVGSILTAKLKGHASNGATLEKDSDVPLYIGAIKPPPPSSMADDGWPSDESTWTKKMRDIAAELRATPKGTGNYHRREITQYGVKEKIESGDTPVLDENDRELGRVSKRSLFLADIEGTMRLNGRILNIAHSGNVYDQSVAKQIGGKTVKKPKPSLDKFDPTKSRWHDVTERAPWGAGAKLPLIPFRVLAHNYKTETPLYGKKVYIQQMDGLRLPTGETHNGICVVGDCGGMAPPGQQFDFFVGREDRHIAMPTLAPSQGGAICNVEILGDCAAAQRKKK